MFTFCGGSHPPLEYDYDGFPPHTYEIRDQASGAGGSGSAFYREEIMGKAVSAMGFGI